MSDKDYQKPPESERISATQLQQRIADSAIEEAKKTAEQARKQNEPKRKEYQDFMERRFTEADRVQLRARAERAADQRQNDVEILRFPSEFLEDHGRRINNFDKDWPVSLTGYAKSVYDAYKDLGQPQGYKLIARVLDYPNGMIGDIGIFLSWK
jgi:hypothetical protein